MSKEYDETKVKPAMSTPQGPEGTNGSKAQSVLSNKRKPTINFDDKKYGVKTSKIDQQSLNKRQESSKLRDLLSAIECYLLREYLGFFSFVHKDFFCLVIELIHCCFACTRS